MARKPLSDIIWSQQSIDEIFAAPIREIESSSKPNINVHEKIEAYEKKTRLNFNKNRPAPPPPGTKIVLPKIGNYKPKILLTRETPKTNSAPKSPYDEVQITESPVSFHQISDSEQNADKVSSSKSFKQTTQAKSEPVDSKSQCNSEGEEGIYHTIDIKPDYEQETENKVMIIGDKDVPLVLDTYFGPDDNTDDIETQKNPDTQRNDEPKTNLSSDNVLSNHDTVVNVGEVVVNPLFEGKKESNETTKHTYKKRRAPRIPSYVSRHRSNSQNSHASDEEFPYIPDPDYDEDEVTMNFDDFGSTSTKIKSEKRDSKVIKEYEGEDFAKYLEEDDGFHEENMITWRKNIKHTRKPTSQSKQPQISKSKFTNHTKINPPKLKPGKKPKHKETQHGSMNNRHTLRGLSYADCKMGLDDRTIRSVKSTSAGGRYIKRGKERTMIVDGGFGGGGYEEFLKMRSKEDGSLESNSSGDSGLEQGDDIYGHEQSFFPMQPKKVREKKGNLWEKLTWRFKRHGGGYRMS